VVTSKRLRTDRNICRRIREQPETSGRVTAFIRLTVSSRKNGLKVKQRRQRGGIFADAALARIFGQHEKTFKVVGDGKDRGFGGEGGAEIGPTISEREDGRKCVSSAGTTFRRLRRKSNHYSRAGYEPRPANNWYEFTFFQLDQAL